MISCSRVVESDRGAAWGPPSPPFYHGRRHFYALGAAAQDPAADAARLSKPCANEAMTLLKRAVAQGYKDAVHMNQDKDLDPLRQREDFQTPPATAGW